MPKGRRRLQRKKVTFYATVKKPKRVKVTFYARKKTTTRKKKPRR